MKRSKMKKFYILFLLLTACSLNNSDNLNKKILDFNKEYSIKEYGAILEKYNARTGYPKIN